MARGKAEAKFSVVRKISAANAIKLLKIMKSGKSVNKMTAPMTKSFKTIGKELHELFSDTVKDYNLADKISAQGASAVVTFEDIENPSKLSSSYNLK